MLELFDTKQAAERLRLAPQTLSKMRCMGEGPDYIKLGNRVVYKLEALQAWVESCELSGKARRKAVSALGA